VMQARSYQCIEPFDDCIAQLRLYFDSLQEAASSKSKKQTRARSSKSNGRRNK
jgi:hypothetical protein